MRVHAIIVLSGFFLLAGAPKALCQNNDAFNSSRVSTASKDKDAFNRNRANNFNDYRASLNAEYAKMLKGKWKDSNSNPAEDAPADDKIPIPTTPWNDGNKRDDKSIVIEEVVKPIKDNQKATPIAPVKVDPEIPVSTFDFSFMGTKMKVRVPNGARFSVGSTNEASIASAWEALSSPEYAVLVADCIKLKNEYKLCDWAYLNMLNQLSRQFTSDINSATLLMAYLYSQSGYRIRLGEANGKLEMLYASKHVIYKKDYYKIDGFNYYPFNGYSSNLHIAQASFPKEQSLSLWIPSDQSLDLSQTPNRTLKSERYPQFNVTTSVNKNLIDFFNTYPTSMVGGNIMTRWAMYANTPSSQHVRTNLYPQLKNLLSGLNELEAVQRLLNWVQTAFVYEYDDKVWGADRAFFPEETLYYPYCDCEDRSILFTRLVRDLIGLKCILVFYPGHLAAAVSFRNEVGGDYIVYNGHRFVITDPTYIGAPVGRTMPDMDNASAKVILLE